LIDISICIVNLNAKRHLIDCLNSINQSVSNYSFEIIIVDNNSSDGSQYCIQDKYRKVHLIKNKRNEGYTAAINQAILVSQGSHIVILNPDSVLHKNSLSLLIRFLIENKDVGIVGPKVTDVNGDFQKSCRRGVAKPRAVFSYFFGLSKLFPNDVRFTGYHLNHLNENDTNEVGGVSGSCMVIKKEVVQHIGLFDERYFAYQEDSDYCLRAKKSGWKVYYNPTVLVTHKGGAGGSQTVPMKAIFEWHRSYYRYYFKHFSKNYSLIFNLFYCLIMLFKLIISEILYLTKA
jgi:GT2 family glycosyltransferase|tara:strand:- start:1314 stop:2180 length:867 start_codon:yes stop_codon:yes gene_type:complete